MRSLDLTFLTFLQWLYFTNSSTQMVVIFVLYYYKLQSLLNN